MSQKKVSQGIKPELKKGLTKIINLKELSDNNLLKTFNN